ncbi:MAG: PIN domain-containing protein, partial [Nanoarchaeota archaeon]
MKNAQKEQVFKKEPIYIDANCFIYASLSKEEIGQKAKEILKQVKSGVYKKAYSSTLTIDEFLWSVQKEVGRDLAAEGAGIFLNLQNFELISIDAQIISKSIELYKEQRKKLVKPELDQKSVMSWNCFLSFSLLKCAEALENES